MIVSKPAPELPERPPVDLLPPLPTMYTYDEVARVMRVGKQTVFEWVKRGKVPSPVYTGHTARFSEDHLKHIMSGVKPAGTYTVADSPRSEVGKLGGPNLKRKWKKGTPKGKPGRPKVKLVADTPAGKKLTAKRRAAKAPKALTTKVIR